jgi:integrase
MKQRLTQSIIEKLEPAGKAYRVFDTECKNLFLNVGTRGTKTWYVYYRDADGKQGNHKLGDFGALTVAQAREAGTIFKSQLIRGELPQKKNTKKSTLKYFIDTYYEPWVTANRKGGAATLQMIRSSFEFMLNAPLDNITLADFEKWRTSARKDGLKSATINRLSTALVAAINWGVDYGHIERNPLAGLKKLRETDSNKKTRYLTDDERLRLMAELPKAPEYLRVMVSLSLGTGIRRGNLFSLLWEDIDFNAKAITLRAAASKSEEQVIIPMSDDVAGVLAKWRERSKGKLVFASPKTGNMIDNVRRSFATLLKSAGIQNFRWHDMRHDFASNLVMKGVDLNTVRELMGHADMKMTLRYAHLAPGNKSRAVNLINIK